MASGAQKRARKGSSERKAGLSGSVGAAWASALALSLGLASAFANDSGSQGSWRIDAISLRLNAVVVSGGDGVQRLVRVGEQVSDGSWQLIGIGPDRAVLAPPPSVETGKPIHLLVAVGEGIPPIEKSKYEVPIHYVGRDLLVQPALDSPGISAPEGATSKEAE